MASSSSKQASMNVESGKNLYIKPRTINIRKEDLKLILEQIIDLEFFNMNGYPIWNLFKEQELVSLFDMLNGPTYPYMVKDFWVRAEVYDQLDTSIEENKKVAEDNSLRGDSRKEMGLKEFDKVEIRSIVMGFDVTITQKIISKLFGVSSVTPQIRLIY
ncbi:unnamed protein product [Lathyrus oleraceus]